MLNPKTGKPYNRFTRMVIEAAKVYGIRLTDTNLWCHAFNGEQGRTFKHLYGVDPWASIIPNAFKDKYGDGGTDLSEFPWDQMEWAPVDYQRPSPDWNLRPGQISPWWRADDPTNPMNTMPS